ncbi:MAG: MotA/TolQ/ExbB proton channel family protein [Betaproteobacteria bacterium]|nr:MotA/TolQ/ExbB proton channel family protein [Betaproteobacteria bacterium]
MESWQALKAGGPSLYPLFILALLALTIMLDRIWLFWRHVRWQPAMKQALHSSHLSWDAVEQEIQKAPRNYYARFAHVLVTQRQRPLWWVESRAQEAALELEQSMGRGLWLLETIVTAAPLLGLLGTITGMMHAFNLIGGNGLVDPAGITGGVAQALIATAVGILIALVALFAFNYFSRKQAKALEEMERLGTLLIDHLRLSSESI